MKILKQFQDIKNKGIKELIKKLKIALVIGINYPFYIIFIITAAPFVILIRLIKPLIHIRFRTISTGQLGHFVFDSGLLLSMSIINKNNDKPKDWYWLSQGIGMGYQAKNWYVLEPRACNNQFRKMIRRTFFVHWWVKYLFIINNIIPGGKHHTAASPREVQGSRDTSGLLHKTKELSESYFKFSTKENSEAKKFLKEIGLEEKDKFVCLCVRDAAYRRSINPYQNFDYHNFRNSDVNTYSLAATELAERGYWVFRMGKTVEKPFDCTHPKVKDYAYNEKKSDLLDIWLLAHCSFCISTGTGIDDVAVIYRKPIAFVNYLPVGDTVSYTSSLTYFKHLQWNTNNKKLNMKECLEKNTYHGEELKKNNIDVIDLTKEEIKETVIEAEERFSGAWRDKDEDIKLQEEFWKKLTQWNKFYKYHNIINPKAKMSALFLRKNTNWLM